MAEEHAGTRPDGVTLAAFFLFVTLAGGNVIAVRQIACDTCELEPFWAAAMRFLLAAVILTAIGVAIRSGIPRGRALLGAVLYGVFGFAGGMDRLAISPQCGFASVMVGNEIDEDTQWRKLELVSRVADELWPRDGSPG